MLFRPPHKLTFGSFLSRPGSVHARSACAHFVSRQGIAFGEPVLILAGRTQAGKTHLLHAAANLGKSNQHIHSGSTLSAHRFAEEVKRATDYGDLAWWLNRFSHEDFLAIDDVDALFYQPKASDFLLHVLRARNNGNRRTLLTATLSNSESMTCPLSDFLNEQVAVRLI